MKRFLIIGPDFFTMMRDIVNEFERSGYICFYWDERYSNHFFIKILYRLQLDFFLFFQKKSYFNKLKLFIRNNKIDYIYLIDVESFARKEIIELLNDKLNLKIYLYTWDSVDNKSKFLTYKDLLSKCSTFDPIDSKNYLMEYIHLYAKDIFVGDAKTKDIDVYVCCTLHSQRPRLLKILKQFSDNNLINSRVNIYYHNRILFFLRCMFSKHWRAHWGNVSFKGFSLEEIASNTKRAKFVLDIAHPKQSGLTARTFEALRSGSVLITNNLHAKSLLPEYADRIITYASEESLKNILVNIKEHSFFDNAIPNQTDELSLKIFARNLLNGI